MCQSNFPSDIRHHCEQGEDRFGEEARRFKLQVQSPTRNKISNDIHDLILEHLHCLPTVPAHYRRAESNKRYFEDDITRGILYKLFKEWMKNTNKRKVENPHNDQISIETVYWETATLIEIEKGSSVITISDTYNIGDGKQVDTKMKPTIRTPRKRPRDLERCQEMELQHLYSDEIPVLTELKKGIT